MERKEILLGNGAIALGLLEGGCEVLTSYPGTPSSEILPEFLRISKELSLDPYVEWSTNEKVALDNALSSAITGKRSACCMKQVGLNVAADSLMSSAYLGVIGGFVIISCDDPGPHSSQTEQDSRMMARVAKVPVMDPSNPEEARKMARLSLELSERYGVPFVLRPAIRVCHARQGMSYDNIKYEYKKADFKKDPLRWAATPKFRLILHRELNKKLKEIRSEFENLSDINFHTLENNKRYPLGIVAGGVPYSVVDDILEEEGLKGEVPVLKIGTPYPFPQRLADEFLDACESVLVLEETDSFIEYLLGERSRIMGRLNGYVPDAGELVPDVIYQILDKALRDKGLTGLKNPSSRDSQQIIEELNLPIRRPTLCPGCPHRSSFFVIRKFSPKAIFTSDIGCYTLGLNLGAVDTCLDMGSAITMASGFYQSFKKDVEEQPIIATIGDSTFFHSGPAGLINAVYNGARFILVILDNQTTAMTGMQPTPGLGIRADGSKGNTITLERLVAGCGVDYIDVIDPYDQKAFMDALKKANEYIKEPEGGIAVIISRHPCVIAYRGEAIPERKQVIITDECKECNFCIDRFECPAIYHDEEKGKAEINQMICAGCAQCVTVCPKGAITVFQDKEE